MDSQTLVFIQNLLNGLSVGAIYALIALGYTMVFGVLRFINFAHGDLLMVGAYTGIIVLSGQAGAIHDGLANGTRSFIDTIPFLTKAYGVVAGALVALSLLVWLARGRKEKPFVLKPVWLIPLITAGLVAALPTLGRAIFGPADAVLGSANEVLPHTGWAIYAIISSMLICAGFGLSLEQICYRPLRSQPRITVLITAIGVSLLLESFAQFAMGAEGSAVPAVIPQGAIDFTTPWNLGFTSIEWPKWFADLIFTRDDVTILVLTLVLLAILVGIVKFTKLGMAMRALAFNPTACSLMGININFVISFTFAIGSGLAGAAGVLAGIKYSAEPLMGIKFGLTAFVAAVVGGIGSLPGAVVGGFLLGIMENLVAGSAYSSYKEAVSFAALIAILLIRPAGLLGKNTREKV